MRQQERKDRKADTHRETETYILQQSHSLWSFLNSPLTVSQTFTYMNIQEPFLFKFYRGAIPSSHLWSLNTRQPCPAHPGREVLIVALPSSLILLYLFLCLLESHSSLILGLHSYLWFPMSSCLIPMDSWSPSQWHTIWGTHEAAKPRKRPRSPHSFWRQTSID